MVELVLRLINFPIGPHKIAKEGCLFGGSLEGGERGGHEEREGQEFLGKVREMACCSPFRFFFVFGG